MNEEEEAALVEASREGDREAFGKLVDAYQKPVFNLALRMLGDREDARDATQETFLRAWESLSSFKPEHRFFSWIYRIAINEALDLRSRRTRPEPIGAWAVSATQGPEGAMLESETSRIVQSALLELKPDHRTVAVLRHLRRCNYREIADILHIPEKTVKSRLFEARQQLKRALEARGVV